jgi:ribosomal protein S13
MTQDTTTIKLGPVNVLRRQNIVYSLAKIPGIGFYQGAQIALKHNIDLTKNVVDLDETVLKDLENFLSKEYYKLNNYEHYLGKFCRYNAKQNIKAHIRLGTEVGQNQQKGYRVHGQKRK